MIRPLHTILIAAALVLGGTALTAQAQTTKPAGGDPVVGRVNGQPITRSEVIEFYSQLPSPMNQIPLEQIRSGIVNELAARKLIGIAAEKAKLDKDPAVKQQLEAAREQVLQHAYLEKKVRTEVTEATLKARYEQLLKSQPPEEEVHARHILVPTEADAKAALEEVKKGADFAEVSKKRSTGPTAATGGDLGFFTKEKMVPEFAEAAFKLQPGQVSEPVKTQFGWHIIKVEERRKAPPPTFEESRQQIFDMMSNEVVEKTVADLRKDAKIEELDWPAEGGKKLPAIAPAEPKKK
ncbi:peptidylprolyl isomerase [Ferrovibrio xuzhouensis]|uniref:Parvulin-like PPIase n=1 Tax=Ferrovibrio xuzhouensis TaxID=1576914 RepID=A0ABV7VE30_9PROT